MSGAPRIKETPGSRHFNQYRIFIRLVHTDYVREHQVSYYALKMNMKPAALCRLVKKESGHTAMEIINNTIIMDAKAQLCTANTPIKDIAVSLRFNNAAFSTILNVIREYLLRSSAHPQNNKIHSKHKMRIFCHENTRIPQ